MTDCEKYQELISAMVDGALSDAEKAETEAHIARCDECRAMYEAFSAVSGATEADEVPATLHSGIMEKVNAAAKAKKTQRRLVRLRPVLAAAACLVVVVGTVFALRGNLGAMKSTDTTAPAAAEAPMMMMANSTGTADADIPAEGGAANGTEAYFAATEESVPAEMPAPDSEPKAKTEGFAAAAQEDAAEAKAEGEPAAHDSRSDASVLPALILRIETIRDSGILTATVTDPEDTLFAEGEVIFLVADDATEPIAFNLVEGGEYRVFYTEIPESETVRIHAERIEWP